jgi:hypothetical protein
VFTGISFAYFGAKRKEEGEKKNYAETAEHAEGAEKRKI